MNNANRTVQRSAAKPALIQDDPTADAAPTSERHERIARAAYLRAAQRGFSAGRELDDWLAAEREIDALESGKAS